jgi:DNA-binding response OmpR family regulator
MAKIFVVDDDKDLLFMIRAMLEKSGFEVKTASDGYEALSVIKSFHPDLMIVDLTMPVMDGWRLSMRVRQEPSFKRMPIIVLSGLVADNEAKGQSYESYNVLIAKPFDIFKLIDRVKELLSFDNSAESK